MIYFGFELFYRTASHIIAMIEEDQMTQENKLATAAARVTVPSYLLERFERDWQQMRDRAAAAPKSADNDNRDR